MSDGWNIALLGATGAVGNAVLELLEQRQFPVNNIYLLASKNSVGKSMRFNAHSLYVQDAAKFDWALAQLAFFTAGRDVVAHYAEEAASKGCLVIESSDLFALEPDVPLVVPNVNPQVLTHYRNRNIITIADSLVSQLLSAIKPIVDIAGLDCLQVTNLISVSSHGKDAVEVLVGESVHLLNGKPVEKHYFGRQLAFNLLPQQIDSTGNVSSERRLVDQTRKVLQNKSLRIAVSSIQVPVFYGNAQIVYLENLCPISVAVARDTLACANNIILSEENDYPTQVSDASSNGVLHIGCVCKDYGIPEMLKFWSVADNIRFGGALMAVKTAEKLVQEHLN